MPDRTEKRSTRRVPGQHCIRRGGHRECSKGRDGSQGVCENYAAASKPRRPDHSTQSGTYACLAADTKKRDTRRKHARYVWLGQHQLGLRRRSECPSMHDACDSAEARADIYRGGHGMFHSRKCRKSQGKPRSYNLTHQPNCPRIYREETGLLRRRSHQMQMPILIRPRADALLL